MPEQPAPESTPAAQAAMPAERLKYLEMLQAAVGRMSGNSSTLKGWTVTLVVALVALAARDGSLWLLAAALIPTLLFAGLDGYYLHLERGYRRLFDRAANTDPTLPLFSLHRAPEDRGCRRWLHTLARPVVWVYYLAVLASLGAALAVFALAPVKKEMTPVEPQKVESIPQHKPPRSAAAAGG
jgi:hypothetical protein